MPQEIAQLLDRNALVRKRIKIALYLRGWKQAQLAQRASIDTRTLSKLLSGPTHWRLDYLEKVCSVFAIHPSDVIDDRQMPLVSWATPQDWETVQRLLTESFDADDKLKVS